MCDDELMPADATVRKARPLKDAFAPAREGRCMDCPKHDAGRAQCPVLGQARPGRAPMCRYGHSLVEQGAKHG